MKRRYSAERKFEKDAVVEISQGLYFEPLTRGQYKEIQVLTILHHLPRLLQEHCFQAFQ